RKGLGWVAGLAAAAAVGLGVVATTQMAEPDQLATMSPQGSSAAAPVAADLARPEAEEAEPALAAPAAPPGAAPASAAPLEVASLEPRDEAEGARAQAARSDRGGIAAATPRPARAAPLASAFDDHEAAPRRRAAASGGPVASSAT